MIQQRRRYLTPVTLGLVVVVAALMAAVAWYLVSPLFVDRRVNESFPTIVAPGRGADTARTSPARDVAPPAQASTDLQASTGGPGGSAQPTNVASAGASTSAAPAMPASAAQAATARQDTPPGRPATGEAGGGETAGIAALQGSVQPSDAAAPPVEGPVATRRGEFGEVDAIHKGEGQATFYRLPDGKVVLRLEDFRVTNGPDLYVYLSGHPAPRSSAELHQDPDYEVAVLKGNVGDQNYELPPGLDLDGVRSVVIYCKRFATVFSTAELRPA